MRNLQRRDRFYEFRVEGFTFRKEGIDNPYQLVHSGNYSLFITAKLLFFAEEFFDIEDKHFSKVWIINTDRVFSELDEVLRLKRRVSTNSIKAMFLVLAFLSFLAEWYLSRMFRKVWE